MNKPYQDPTEKKTSIAKIQGMPERDDEGRLNRREAWEVFCNMLGQKLAKSVGLAEAYAEAKVAQETNSARKTAEEAAEIAAEKRRTNAETRIKRDKARQESVRNFTENVERILRLPPEGQGITMAKLFMENPEIEDQLDKIVATLEKLHTLRGLGLAPLIREEVVDEG